MRRLGGLQSGGFAFHRYYFGGCANAGYGCGKHHGLDSFGLSFVGSMHSCVFSMAGVAKCCGSVWVALCTGVFTILEARMGSFAAGSVGFVHQLGLYCSS